MHIFNKKISHWFLVLSFSSMFCFSSYAEEAITNLSLDVVHTKTEITTDDIYIQANTPYFTCEKKEYRPVTEHITLYLRAAEGYRFMTQRASQIELTGASYVAGKKEEQSTLLVLTVDLTDDVTWLESRNGWQNDEYGIKHQNEDGSYSCEGWNLIDSKYYYFDSDGYVLIKTTTPDGYKVNTEGEWDNNSPTISSNASVPS